MKQYLVTIGPGTLSGLPDVHETRIELPPNGKWVTRDQLIAWMNSHEMMHCGPWVDELFGENT